MMSSIYLNTLFAGLKILLICSVSKAGLAAATVLWQHSVYFGGLHRFCRIARTLPFLALELRTRLNLRYWVTRISRLARYANCRTPLPPILSPKFLVSRDGRNIFDLFKTLSLSDVSPPAFVYNPLVQ